MAMEKKWSEVPPQTLTANGTTLGVVVIADTVGFYIKQVACLTNSSGPSSNLPVQIKRILNTTTMIVGLVDNKIASFAALDISAYTTAAGSQIGAQSQNKNSIPDGDHYLAIYEGDQINADRVIGVDQYGRFYNKNNPLPVGFDGTISIGEVEVVGSNGNIIEPNPDGSINVNIVSTPSPGNTVINQYSEANSVGSGITTLVLQYTVPLVDTNAVLQRISVAGENIAKWTVFWNATQIDTRRTFYGNLNEYFEFTTGGSDGFVLQPGDTIKVYVLHMKPYVADFEARIQVLQIT
jgi:hypothetical protein